MPLWATRLRLDEGNRVRVNLRKVLFILPNLFTLSSIFCGFYAAVLCLGTRSGSAPTADDFNRAAVLIVFAMFFDAMDGRVARLTKTQSAFGVQIDSLADLSSFGVAPAAVAAARAQALVWALERGSRSGRVAYQFARDYAGRHAQ